jgi:hypothetical protein
MRAASVPTLDTIARKGTCVKFYDPDGSRCGRLTYPYRWAPKGLLTRQRLTASGL